MNVAEGFRPREIASDHWDSHVQQTEEPLVFHSRRWLDTIHQCYGFEPFHLMEASPEGTALLPLFLVNSPVFGRKLVTQPFNFYGGLLFNSTDAAKNVLTTAQALWRQQGTRFLEIRNVAPLPQDLVEEFHLIERSPMVRYVIPLHENSTESDRQMKGRFRTNLRLLRQQAAATGIVVTDTDPDESALRVFYDLLTDEYRKKHFMIVQPYRLFHLLANALRPNFRIVTARDKERTLAAAVLIRFNGVDYYLWGAYDLAAASISPLTLVLDAAMQFARSAGSTHLDLGVTSRSHQGLLQYKSRWGGVCEPLHYYYMAERQDDVPSLDYFDSFRAIRKWIRFVPRRIVQRLSPPVIRWLG